MRRLGFDKGQSQDGRQKRSPVRDDGFGLGDGLKSLNNSRGGKKYHKSYDYDDIEEDEEYENDEYIEPAKNNKKKGVGFNKDRKQNNSRRNNREEEEDEGDSRQTRPSRKTSTPPKFIEKHRVEKVRDRKSQKLLVTVLIIVGIMFIVGGYIGYSMSQKTVTNKNTTNVPSTTVTQEDKDKAEKLAQEKKDADAKAKLEKEAKEKELLEINTGATNLVATAEVSKIEGDITIAQDAVTKLTDVSVKTALQARIDALKQSIIDSQAKVAADAQAKADAEAQAQAEATAKANAQVTKKPTQPVVKAPVQPPKITQPVKQPSGSTTVTVTDENGNVSTKVVN